MSATVSPFLECPEWVEKPKFKLGRNQAARGLPFRFSGAKKAVPLVEARSRSSARGDMVATNLFLRVPRVRILDKLLILNDLIIDA